MGIFSFGKKSKIEEKDPKERNRRLTVLSGIDLSIITQQQHPNKRSVIDEEYGKISDITDEELSIAASIQELTKIADGYAKQRKLDDAIKNYLKILELNPDDDIVLMSVGNCFADLNQYSEAAIYLNKALDINPKSQRIKDNINSVLQKSGLTQPISFGINNPDIIIKQIEPICNLFQLFCDAYDERLKQSKYYEAFLLHTKNVQEILSKNSVNQWYEKLINELMNTSNEYIEERSLIQGTTLVICVTKLSPEEVPLIFSSYGGYKVYLREKILESDLSRQAVHLIVAKNDSGNFMVFPNLYMKNPELTLLQPNLT